MAAIDDEAAAAAGPGATAARRHHRHHLRRQPQAGLPKRTAQPRQVRRLRRSIDTQISRKEVLVTLLHDVTAGSQYLRGPRCEETSSAA